MARTAGQIRGRGPEPFKRWLVSVYLCRDANGKKIYQAKTVKGGRKAAEKQLRAMLREKDTGRLVVPSRAPFEEFLEQWLEKAVKPRTRASTLASYTSILDNYVKPELGRIRMDKLGALQLQGLVAKLAERGLAPRTIRYALALVNSALRTALRWRMLAWNPVDEVDLPPPTHTELVVPQANARKALVDALKADGWWPLWALMITTGLRPGEALGLQWPDVDLDGRMLRVKRALSRVYVKRDPEAPPDPAPAARWTLAEPKTHAGVRSIPLHERTAEILRRHRVRQLEERMRLGEYYHDQAFVFAGPLGEPLEWHNVRARHFKRAAARAAMTCAVCGELLVPTGDDHHPEHRDGRRFDHDAAPHPELARLRPYDLRHLHASLLLAAGTDLKTVSERLGHANAGFTLETYTHVVPGTQAAATAAIGEEIFGKGGNG